jgi:ATP-binding cassette subfamily B protein
MFIILAFFLAFGYLKNKFALRMGQSIDSRLILGYYRHLLRLPLRFFDTMQVGEITSRVNDAVKIRAFINNTLIEVVLNLFVISFSLVAMFIFFPKLVLLAGLFLPIFAVLYAISDRLNKRYQKKLMEDAADVQRQFVESLNGIGTIKRFHIEEYAISKTENLFFRLLQTVYSSGGSSLIISTSAELLTRTLTLLILWTGSFFVIHQQLSAGELMSFYSLTGYFTLPLSGLLYANRSIREAAVASDRLFDIIDLETDEKHEQEITLEASLTEDIIIEKVDFHFGNRPAIFEALSMTIPRAKSTAIVGESGSGKSTLISLLQRLYPVDSGRILINGYDIRYVDNRSLQQLIAVVPQQIEIFSGTIIENIAIGEYEPDLKKVMDLSHLLGLNEFIEKLPENYYTLLSEQGINLSGGERQRIAIARALYREPQVLILDEATSSLDPQSEFKVQQALKWFLDKQKTVIIIAHRLSTVKSCDKIMVLKHGRLTEDGNHHELMALNGSYANMWKQSC